MYASCTDAEYISRADIFAFILANKEAAIDCLCAYLCRRISDFEKLSLNAEWFSSKQNPKKRLRESRAGLISQLSDQITSNFVLNYWSTVVHECRSMHSEMESEMESERGHLQSSPCPADRTSNLPGAWPADSMWLAWARTCSLWRTEPDGQTCWDQLQSKSAHFKIWKLPFRFKALCGREHACMELSLKYFLTVSSYAHWRGQISFNETI